MRACTATVTEISYNHSDDPHKLYRAEVEFITATEWHQELESLLGDLRDDSGQISKDFKNPDTVAGLAFSKIKAVYPLKTSTRIVQSSASDLVNEPDICGLLGQIKHVNETTSAALSEGLQHYVDSKEKTAKSAKVMEYWPLIKVVRIYCKAHVLSTGAIVVDLPGVQDRYVFSMPHKACRSQLSWKRCKSMANSLPSNAARAAIAENYMKTCDSLWVAAAIQRAVDDKSARKLFSDSFKRQLKLDGQISAVTFICTKTDDILESEVIRSLDLDDLVVKKRAKIDEFRKACSRHEREKECLHDQMNGLELSIEDLEAREGEFEELLTRTREGEAVFSPLKRQQHTCPVDEDHPNKRRGAIGILANSPAYINSEEDDADSTPPSEGSSPISERGTEEELVKLRRQKKEMRLEKKGLQARIAANQEEIRRIEQQQKVMSSDITESCVKARNDYSRNAIKRDFANGIEE